MARNNAVSRALRSNPPSHHPWRQAFFLSRPLRQVVAPNDNLLVVHLPGDLLTLISGHRRGARQLHAIELRPPIPLMLSSPTSKKRSHCGQRQDIPTSSKFSSATTVSSLWRSLLPKLPATWRSVSEASELSQRQGAKTESQTLLSSDNTENLKPSRAKESARRTRHQNTVSGQRPCGCSLHLDHVQFRFRKHT